jgi:carbon starvation protein CstA
MISFIVSIIALILGFLFYSKFVEKIFGSDDKIEPPAIRLRDDVDYVPMSEPKMFLIQLLNIAGLGPIFGAIQGALWGPAAFFWIVLGTIFAGGVHDYFSGMLSVRNDGGSVSEVTGKYLGTGVKQFMRIFTIILLVLTGVVFLTGPADILVNLTGYNNREMFILIIFTYYFLATMIPIDKLIGKIYPFFGACLVFMVLGVGGYMIFAGAPIPNFSFANMHSQPSSNPIFPLLFITIACGAISGFHSTQSPLMARCLTKESQGRRIFYGAMVAEGVIALIWAAAAMSFFGDVKGLAGAYVKYKSNSAVIVNLVCNTWLGRIGGILAVLGVVACPITSGDTAFRSARLTVGDMTKFDQKPIKNRLLIAVPMFVVGYILTKVDFGVIWRYFGWSNQTLATIVLWTASMYLVNEHKNHWITTIPAVFMTSVCVSYICMTKIGFSLPIGVSDTLGVIVAIVLFVLFMIRAKHIKNVPQNKTESV